jgi:hypothetical protein
VKRGGRLPEALIEVATTLTAGDVDENAVEHHALLLVLVEAEVEKLPQITPALRRAEGESMPNVADAGVAVLCGAVTEPLLNKKREEAGAAGKGVGFPSLADACRIVGLQVGSALGHFRLCRPDSGTAGQPQ